MWCSELFKCHYVLLPDFKSPLQINSWLCIIELDKQWKNVPRVLTQILNYINSGYGTFVTEKTRGLKSVLWMPQLRTKDKQTGQEK